MIGDITADPHMAAPLPPAVRRTIVCLDVEKFGPRITLHQVAVREGLYRALYRAFDLCGVPRSAYRVEDRGDGMVILVSPDIPERRLAARLPRAFAAALAEHNRTSPPVVQIRLRMAMHAGEIVYDRHGVAGTSLVLASRLLDATELRDALAGSSGALAVIASDRLYGEVIVNAPGSEPASYRRVHVSVKEAEVTAWIFLPDDDPRPDGGPDATRLPAAGPRISSPWATVQEPGTSAAAAFPTVPHSGAREVGPTMARRMLGERLRRMRETRKLSRRDAGSAINGSGSKICRIEQGLAGVEQGDVTALLAFYGGIDVTEHALCVSLAARSTAWGCMNSYDDVLPARVRLCLELEHAAQVIRGYEPHVIPRLLQTPDYARTVWLDGVAISASARDRWVNLLMTCQQILDHRQPPNLWVIIGEAALQRGRDAHAATVDRQIRHLIEVSELPNVRIQILPSRASVAYAGAITMVRCAAYRPEPVVFLEQPAELTYFDKPADIEHYQEVMDRVGVHAARPEKTAAILKKILSET